MPSSSMDIRIDRRLANSAWLVHALGCSFAAVNFVRWLSATLPPDATAVFALGAGSVVMVANAVAALRGLKNLCRARIAHALRAQRPFAFEDSLHGRERCAATGWILPGLFGGILQLPPGSTSGLLGLWAVAAGCAVVILSRSSPDRLRGPKMNARADLRLHASDHVEDRPAASVVAQPKTASLSMSSSAANPSNRTNAADGAKRELPDLSIPRLTVFEPQRLNATEGDDEDDETAVTQWMSRTAVGEDGERIEGVFRVTFEAGQRLAWLHIPFVPSLAHPPELEAHLTEGDDAVRLKVAAAHRYGVRIEARRSSTQEGISIEVGIEGLAAADSHRAA